MTVAAWVAAWLGPVAAVALLFVAGAAQAQAVATPLVLQRLAEGVYVHTGRQEETAVDNRGDIANLGVVIGERCVAVVDSGGSRAVGEALRAAIRALTPRPVCYVINTHMHPDHVFGNAAFVADQPAFVGHAKLAAALAARRSVYGAALQRLLGEAAAGSELVVPTVAVADTLVLDLGARRLELRAWPTAHTDNDLTVFDEASGTLWLGDLVFDGHLPVVDGSLKGWLALHPVLAALPARHRVPGHGAIDPPWPERLARQQAYLEGVARTVRKALAANQTLSQVLQDARAPDQNQWLLIDAFHLRNLSAAFAELEWE